MLQLHVHLISLAWQQLAKLPEWQSHSSSLRRVLGRATPLGALP